jgi:Fe-S cluster biosynthesis and repair protein YggX
MRGKSLTKASASKAFDEATASAWKAWEEAKRRETMLIEGVRASAERE